MGKKIISLMCPQCGGALNTTDKGTGFYKCPFCGTQIYFDDGIKRTEKTININKHVKNENYNYNVTRDENKSEENELLEMCCLLPFMVFAMIFLLVVLVLTGNISL